MDNCTDNEYVDRVYELKPSPLVQRERNERDATRGGGNGKQFHSVFRNQKQRHHRYKIYRKHHPVVKESAKVKYDNRERYQIEEFRGNPPNQHYHHKIQT